VILHLASRLIAVAFGVATVGLWWRIAGRAYGPTAGRLAGLFLACAYLHVRESHFGTTDVPMVFFIVAAHGPLLSIVARGRWGDYLAAGALIGLATATKYTAAPLVASLVVAHVVRVRRGCASRPWLRLAGAVAVAGGLVGLLRQRDPRALVLLVFPVLAYAALAFRRTVFVRYALPLAPFVAGWAAWLCLAARRRLGRPWPALLLCAVLAPGLVRAMDFDALAARLDTRCLAAEWLRGRLAPGETVGWVSPRPRGTPRGRSAIARCTTFRTPSSCPSPASSASPVPAPSSPSGAAAGRKLGVPLAVLRTGLPSRSPRRIEFLRGPCLTVVPRAGTLDPLC